MHFGKSGGRCKSLQCWMMSWTCVDMEKRGFVFNQLEWVVVVCFNNISLQKRKQTLLSSLIAGEVEGSLPTSL